MAALRGSRPNAGTCTENDNLNLSSNVNPSSNVEENYSDSQEDDNLSYLENEIINDDNLPNVNSALGPDNDKTLNILGRERNDF